MKLILTLLLALAAFPVLNFAQEKTITIMVFRHADKEAPVEGDETEPDLSIDGQKRAVKIAFMLRKYKPNRILSTKYARTVQTVTPLMKLNKLDVEFYEPGKLADLAEMLRNSADKRNIAVAGHSSTSFKLVNLLLKQEKYTQQAESDYGRLWIVKIKKGKVVEELILF